MLAKRLTPILNVSDMHLDVIAVEALDRAVRTEIIDLCESAYHEDFARLFDELPGSIHVLARDDRGVLVSHAEWVTRWLQPGDSPPLRTAYVEAVATAPERQRQGLGTAVLRRLAGEILADARWELGALSPSVPGFYARLGWELCQGSLAIRRERNVEPSAPDAQVMILRLPRTPADLDMTSLLTAEWRVGEVW